MKINEALIIGAGLLAALVLSKSQDLTSNIKEFSGKSTVSVLPVENKIPYLQTRLFGFQIPQIQTFLQKIKLPNLEIFPQFFPVTDTNVQLKEIVNIEEEKKDQRVSYLQDELDQTRAYIKTQEVINSSLGRGGNPRSRNASAYLYQSDVQRISNLTGKEKGDYTSDDVINYYEDLVESESALGFGGSATGGSFRKFPKVTPPLTSYYNKLIAQRNITKAEVYEDRQQTGINLIEKEYQTRFGGLSRYG